MSAVHEHEVQMRWQDIDGLGHVNHNVAVTYLEEGRDALLDAIGIGRADYVVGRCSIEYRAEIDPTFGVVRVQCEVVRVGTSSITTSERILDGEGGVAVEAEFGIVLWDAERRGSRPITDHERAALEGGRTEEASR
jgi:acyl-CoA thioester hydrolase